MLLVLMKMCYSLRYFGVSEFQHRSCNVTIRSSICSPSSEYRLSNSLFSSTVSQLKRVNAAPTARLPFDRMVKIV